MTAASAPVEVVRPAAVIADGKAAGGAASPGEIENVCRDQVEKSNPCLDEYS